MEEEQPISQIHKPHGNAPHHSNTPHKSPDKSPHKSQYQSYSSSRRLIVKQIVLENFKSYEGRQIIGPFHKRFTSVVGPNGSGKSNLIESLLFIFGRRARDMRLKQLHQLIHNSNEEQNQAKKASVEVQFVEILDQEGEEYEVIPNTEFSVKRTVNHASVSEYEINHSKVKADDVTQLLLTKGIDLNNNRFLILQGEVESISIMKPKSGNQENPGLLEYLEDIIGSGVHKETIEKNQVRYEELQELRREKGERMRFSQKDLDKLNDAKNTAIEFIRREKNLFQLQNIISQQSRFSTQQELKQQEEKKEKVDKKAQQTKSDYQIRLKDFEQIRQVYKKQKKELDDQRAVKSKCQEQLAKLQEKDDKLKSDMKFETENQVKQEKTIADLTKDQNKTVDEMNEIKKDLPIKQQQILGLRSEKEESDNLFREMSNNLKQKNEKLMKTRQQIKKNLDPHLNEISNLNLQLSQMQSQHELLSRGNEDIQQEVVNLNDKLEKNESDMIEVDQVITQIQTAITNIEYQKKLLTNKVQEASHNENNLLKELNQQQDNLNLLQQQNVDNQQRSGVVQELMMAQSNNQFDGICGRLGDLGAIDQEFDVAISTACFQLDNVVTKTYQSAQNALNYLKENKIGRMTFIPLDKMEQYRDAMKKSFTAPSGSKRLFDLIKFKNEDYKTAFYFALRDTLVCQDIDTATKIAYGQQRYRVVTLDGKLIELSGTMSGGGKVKKGGMSSKITTEVDQQEVNRLKNQIKDLRDQYQYSKQEKIQMQNQLEEISKDFQLAKKTLQERQTDYDDANKNKHEIEMKIQGYQKILDKSDNDNKEKKVIETQISGLQKEIKLKEQSSQSLKDQLQQLDEEIEKQGGSEFQVLKKRKIEVEEKYNKLEKEISTLTSKLEQKEKNLKKIDIELKNSNTKLQKIYQKIELMKKDFTAVEDEALEILGRIKAAEEKEEYLIKEQRKSNKEKEEFEKVIEEMKNSLASLNTETEKIKGEVKKIKEELEKHQKKVTQNREKYKDVSSQYDFLNELDQIANYKIDAPPESDSKPNQANQMEIEDQTHAQEQTSLEPDRKRLRFADDLKWVNQVEVDRDLFQEELESIDKYKENLRYQLTTLNDRLNTLKNEANITTIMEFKQKYLDYLAKRQEFENANKEMIDLYAENDKLKKKRLSDFMDGFSLISQKLKETYQTLTSGGDAELELIDFQDPFSEGINFTVRPPKKAWKKISKLSGGEKTLSSLSLVFALHYYKPTPLYFMDEIDASLDFKNVSIVGHYVKERTKNAQFIIISLRNNMFELANKLVGVYKTFDATKTVSIYPHKLQQKIKKIQKNDI